MREDTARKNVLKDLHHLDDIEKDHAEGIDDLEHSSKDAAFKVM